MTLTPMEFNVFTWVVGLLVAGFGSYMAVRVALTEQKQQLVALRESTANYRQEQERALALALAGARAEISSVHEMLTIYRQESEKLDARVISLERRCFEQHKS